jgi:phage recombination protein Bet
MTAAPPTDEVTPAKKAPRKRAPRKAATRAKAKADEQAPEQEPGTGVEAGGAAPGEPGPAAEQPPVVEGEVPDEPVQPGEVAANRVGEVEIVSPHGLLTLRADQRRLNPDQRGALAAIGIDPEKDPAVGPHILPFIHMCQLRGLDPWAKEAYLIGRGKDNNRKFTMQVGIDGYLKIANATGRFIRVKKIRWTGTDDDDRSWVQAVDDDGDVVMKRRWWEVWPEDREGHPGQAKVTIEHYDQYGNVQETTVIADWGMYAPYNDVWEGPQGNRHKKVGPDGKPVRELGEMWEKGGPHMLAKCGTALAVRRAFPGATAGVYVHEEMAAADAMESRREEARQRVERREALDRLRPADAPQQHEGRVLSPEEALLAAPSDVPVIDIDPDGDEGTRGQGPLGTETPEADEEQRREWVLDEIDFMCDVLDTVPGKLMARWMRQHRKNPPEGTLAELLPFVAGLRPDVITAMREAADGETAAAEHYAQIPPESCGPRWWLLGLPNPAEREPSGPTLVGEVIDEVREDLAAARGDTPPA